MSPAHRAIGNPRRSLTSAGTTGRGYRSQQEAIPDI